MIEAHELTERYGDKTAVDSISFTIAPGTVTGFLGPNGAGADDRACELSDSVTANRLIRWLLVVGFTHGVPPSDHRRRVG